MMIKSVEHRTNELWNIYYSGRSIAVIVSGRNVLILHHASGVARSLAKSGMISVLFTTNVITYVATIFEKRYARNYFARFFSFEQI